MPSSDTQFKKGQSGNPKGRPPVSSARKIFSKQFEELLFEIFLEYQDVPVLEIKKISKNKKLSLRNKLALKVFLTGLTNDKTDLSFWLLKKLFKN